MPGSLLLRIMWIQSELELLVFVVGEEWLLENSLRSLRITMTMFYLRELEQRGY